MVRIQLFPQMLQQPVIPPFLLKLIFKENYNQTNDPLPSYPFILDPVSDKSCEKTSTYRISLLKKQQFFKKRSIYLTRRSHLLFKIFLSTFRALGPRIGLRQVVKVVNSNLITLPRKWRNWFSYRLYFELKIASFLASTRNKVQASSPSRNNFRNTLPTSKFTFRITHLPYTFYSSVSIESRIHHRYLFFPSDLHPLIIEILTPTTDSIRPILGGAFSSVKLGVHFWLKHWIAFAFLYGAFCELPALQLYAQMRSAERKARLVKHLIRFKFKGPRLNLSIADSHSRLAHCVITPGTFMRYFGRKKSIKKLQSLKLLSIRFLRKLIIVLNLKNLILHSRGIPVAFESLLEKLYRPLPHPFTDPFTRKTIDETSTFTRKLNIVEVIFLRPKPFGFSKQRKRGRIKRKIRRRVMGANRVVDEM